MTTDIQDAINRILVEGGGVDEQGRNEIDVASQLIDELRLPALGSRALAEVAVFTRES